MEHMGLDTPGFIPSCRAPLVQKSSMLARILPNPSQEEPNDSALSDLQSRTNVGITCGGTTIVVECGPEMGGRSSIAWASREEKRDEWSLITYV
ncbi:uncharacterized protein N7503_009469 [Penicillium pulvis]|uniref:uncharacterized protein n=1 Tax=Penicillium pulvis TaxID=1562058 RepID=UPI002548AC84|nr:uncharacterized protein N7503_009469 [Penicillium pulvis]KAJ5784257.1 hypothetical protein N7503_009469 [Penicillium pulvis]